MVFSLFSIGCSSLAYLLNSTQPIEMTPSLLSKAVMVLDSVMCILMTLISEMIII